MNLTQVKKSGLVLVLAFVQNAWSESGLMHVINTPVSYQEGEIHEAPGASMQCQMDPEYEAFQEYWFINGLELSISDPDYPEEQWFGLYNPAEEQFLFSENYSEDIPVGDVIFTSEHSYTWDVTWSPESQAYVGSITENAVLSWNLDSRTSTCSVIWDMVATGTPSFSLESIFHGSSVRETAFAQ